MKGKTKSGFAFEIDESIFQDVEFLERLASSMEGEGFEVFHLIEELLGKDGKAALYNHVRNDEGKVLLEPLTKELDDIFTQASEDPQKKR